MKIIKGYLLDVVSLAFVTWALYTGYTYLNDPDALYNVIAYMYFGVGLTVFKSVWTS